MPDTSTAVADLARRVNHFTEAELAALAGVLPSTLEAWRKRRLGPSWVRFGNAVLYPVAAVEEHLQQEVREMDRTPARSVL